MRIPVKIFVNDFMDKILTNAVGGTIYICEFVLSEYRVYRPFVLRPPFYLLPEHVHAFLHKIKVVLQNVIVRDDRLILHRYLIWVG